ISNAHDTAPNPGNKYGPNGTLNGLGRAGSLCRKTITPTHTSTNAKRVPMFVKLTISSTVAIAAMPPTATPVRIVVTCGVLKRGCTLANTDGSSPSRAIEKKMRGCPSWNTRSTAVCATTDPKAMTVFCHNACGATLSRAMVSDSPLCAEVQPTIVRHGTIPVNTAATAT